MAQHDIPILQENAAGVFKPVTLAPAAATFRLVGINPTTRAIQLSILPAGAISISGNATATTVSAVSTWTKVEIFNSNDLSQGGITADQANDQLAITVTGVYLVGFNVSYSGSANDTWEFELQTTLGTSFANVLASSKLNAGGDITTVSAAGPVSLTAGDYLALYTQNITDGDSVTVRDGSLWAVQLA